VSRLEELVERFGWLKAEDYSRTSEAKLRSFVVVLLAEWSPKDYLLLEGIS
jgi:hypothetical protein